MNVSFTKSAEDIKSETASYDTVVVPVFKGGELGQEGTALNKELRELLEDQIALRNGFGKTAGDIMPIDGSENTTPKRFVLVATGQAYDPSTACDAGQGKAVAAALYKHLTAVNAGKTYIAQDFDHAFTNDFSVTLADELNAADYAFDKYKSKAAASKPLDLHFAVADTEAATQDYTKRAAVTEAQKWAKDLTNEPPNKLYPAVYAEQIIQKLAPLGVKVSVIEDEELVKMGAGAISAVGQGSPKSHKPRMVIMEYDGTAGSDSDAAPLGLIGKGVTFDTGGISLKPSGSIADMHMDMGGSAMIVGTMMALAGRQAQSKVVAIVGLSDNDIGPDAYKPGDIITSLSGQTIHVGNTDAEGRLVMADCMTYLQQNYKPHTIVDAATLTGAVHSIFGHTYAGVFTNDDTVWSTLETAGKTSGEQGWRLPLHEVFNNAVKHNRADLSNIGGIRFGGGSTAAEFLHHFIEKDENGKETPWAHIDIAGAAMPPGGMANGFGVRMLDQWIADNYEESATATHAQAPSAPKPS